MPPNQLWAMIPKKISSRPLHRPDFAFEIATLSWLMVPTELTGMTL
jgi:hypothetical protein